MGGGGGNSGSIKYPDYLQDWHEELLYNSSLPSLSAGESLHEMAFHATDGIFGTSNNPYVGVASYDPSTILDTAQDELQELEGMLDQLNLASEMPVLHLATRDLMKLNLAQAYNRVSATMAAANAVTGSAFPSAQAIVEAQFGSQVAAMELQHQYEQIRNKAVTVQIRLDHMKMKIAAFMDQTRQDVSYNVEEIMWNVNAHLRIMSAIGAISGVATVTSKSGDPSTTASVLGGMASGAAMGTMIMPGWGTAIGAGIGGLMGAFAS